MRNFCLWHYGILNNAKTKVHKALDLLNKTTHPSHHKMAVATSLIFKCQNQRVNCVLEQQIDTAALLRGADWDSGQAC